MIEVQFNWIFVLIVGAVILAFFVSIVVKQQGYSEGKLGAKLSADLETLTTGAQVSKGTVQTISLPSIEIDFQSPECMRSYTIGGWTKNIEENLIFAPSRIESREVIAWTLDWSMPYRITNFLYLTTPQIRYLFVAVPSDDFALSVNKSLPESLYLDYTDTVSTVEDYNNNMVRMIFFSSQESDVKVPSSLADMDNKALTALRVVPSASYETGSLYFYEKKGSEFELEDSSSYIGLEALYGAIFADDPEVYKCDMREAFRKMYFVTDILMNRTDRLQQDFAGGACANEYYLAYTGPLRTMYSNATLYKTDFPPSSVDAMTELHSAQSDLEQYNHNLQLKSCPEVY